MKGIRVLTDINSDLTNDYIKENNIEVVPMYYRFDNETIYGDENNLTIEEFYDNFKTIIPKTMGCNPEKIKEKMEKCIKEGFDVLCIMFSSALSVSYNSALIAKQMIEEDYPDAKIEVIDSKKGSLGEGYMVKESIRLIKEGLNIEKIKEYIENNRNRFITLFSVDKLETLIQSGRINKTIGALGTLISIKPVLSFDEEGNICKLSVKRGINKVAEEIALKIKEFNPKEVTIAHANDILLAEKLKKIILDKAGIDKIEIINLNFCTAACGGPSSFGISFYK